jgi:predicted Rossmann fold flavoprotein
MNKIYNIAIIGGGPAGIMSAISASQNGASVILIEKNHKIGTKLLLTGGGRCNLTNIKACPKDYGKEGDFLIKSFSEFGALKTIEFFKKKGLKTKVEENGRVFPITDKAQDVVNVLMNCLKENKVEVLYNSRVAEFNIKNKKIASIILENGDRITAQNFIICTGGKSYDVTGSTGDGYAFAEKLGHKIKNPKPALVPIKIKEDWVKKLQGISLKNIQLSIFQNKKRKLKQAGEVIFTHFGISGPLIINISKDVGNLLEKGDVKIALDLNPDLTIEILDKKLQDYFLKNPNKIIKNCLLDFAPEKLSLEICNLASISQEKIANNITRQERQNLVKLLKDLEMTAVGLLDFNLAMVTSGGILLKEIDAKIMASKLIDNLYFAGEIIDLCGATGGFNLELCWSTGYLAGKSSAEKLI